ncbi:MAG: DUF4876 domain-containing protein [Prevotella sp.]|nr:DUF4876 domain-containing protein [Prevotella sp.]
MNRRLKNAIYMATALMALASCQGTEIAEDSTPGGKLPVPDKRTEIKHLLLQEICYAGTEITYGEGKKIRSLPYTYDSYIRIVNPSKERIYLDGLALATSAFSSGVNWQFSGDTRKVIKENFCTNNMVQFPGTGKDYPIEPGQSVLITAAALNHQLEREDAIVGNNPNSYDLSHPDFEWMTKEQMMDEWDELEDDNTIPNMLPIVKDDEFSNPSCSSFMNSTINSSALAIIRLGTPVDSLSKDEFRHTYVAMEGSSHSHQMDEGTCVKIPNAWVIDAVSICPEEEFKAYNISEKLDKGYRGVRKRRNEDIHLYAGKALFRKNDGRNFIDTDNSAVDFEVKAASMGGNQ